MLPVGLTIVPAISVDILKKNSKKQRKTAPKSDCFSGLFLYSTRTWVAHFTILRGFALFSCADIDLSLSECTVVHFCKLGNADNLVSVVV